ncbi:tubulin-tyrosine ligase family-domain-containing protein [Syncephalis fuscata]|nr:tubulin-tyrosine ligase family-domain-containing protein [Syncephalis fuscata]
MLTDATTLQQFLAVHAGQLEVIGFPKELWSQLHRKLLIGQVAQTEPEFSVEDVDVKGRCVRYINSGPLEPSSNVFLIDHLLTFEREQLRKKLSKQPALLNSLNSQVLVARGLSMSIDSNDESTTAASLNIDELIRRLWYFASAYSLTLMNEDGKPTVHWYWYIPDAFGAALQHDANANFTATSFMELTTGRAYTLVWPNTQITCGQLCTLDLLSTTKNAHDRKVLACAYLPDALQKEYAYFKLFYNKHCDTLEKSALSYASTVKTNLDLAMDNSISDDQHVSPLRHKETVSYWLDPAYRHVQDASIRTSNRFIPASSKEEADIVWIFDIMTTFQPEDSSTTNATPTTSQSNKKKRSKNKKKKQLTNNNNNNNNLLAQTLNEVYGPSVKWIPRTYNLNHESGAFLADYYETKNAPTSSNNAWITKPWNGSRSEGCAISDNAAELLKQLAIGPRIVQKYLAQPALLNNRKFDLRVLVAVKSLYPLRAYTLRSVPCYARVADEPYPLSTSNGDVQWDNFNRHFTVMNYRSDVAKAQQADQQALRTELEAQHGIGVFDGRVWPAIQRCLRDVFIATVVRGNRHTPSLSADKKIADGLHPSVVGGLRPYKRSRAIYGVDIMLDDTLQPHLIEVSFCPDMKTPIRMHPPLMAELFTFLYLDQGDEHFESII